MLFFGVCFFLYFIKLSAGNGFLTISSRSVLVRDRLFHLYAYVSAGIAVVRQSERCII